MKKRKSKKASFIGSVGIFLFSFLAFMTVRWALIEPYVIPSGSMIPNLLIHDHIFVSKMAYGLRWPFSKQWISSIKTPQRGDIVVFRSVESSIHGSEYYMIKRVVGLPGDTVQLDSSGALLINNEPIPRELLDPAVDKAVQAWDEQDLSSSREDFLFYQESFKEKSVIVMQDVHGMSFDFPSWEVPQNSLFVMGDNRSRSRDSRYWGVLPLENLVGKALFVWLSCQKTLASASFLCDPTTIRWNRIFHTVN